MDGFPYIPGILPADPGPLGRYLPLAPDGVTAAFLAAHVPPGNWVLDPFGASPRTAAEMARAGYRVLVAVNNPIARFLFELSANPPTPALLRSALADLAAARKTDERLETHLQALYVTTCAKCQKQVQVEAFVWERGSEVPSTRIYHCSCGENGEFPVTEADKALARQMTATDSLHRARALERVAAPDDPDRVHVAETLECYLPRAVYALITLVNKLDGLFLPIPRQRALMALLLTAFDDANTLWPYPGERPRPKQLTVPPRFLEKNIWLALERGVDSWPGNEGPVPVTIWPELPGETGGLCLYEGPMRDLAPQLKEISTGAVVSVVPRPNQAFWTLSALWAGWLWGRPAAASFKSILRRRRFDWNWHAAALYATFKNLSAHVALNTPLFALVPEMEPSFLSATLLAAAGAGFDLNGLALRTRLDPAQILWRRNAIHIASAKQPEVDPESVQNAIESALLERGEPAPYLHLHAAGLTAMASDQSLRWREEALTQLHTPIQAALAKANFVHHTEGTSIESGLWGLADWEAAGEPLPDRVEMVIVRFVYKFPGCSTRDVEAAVNAELPGLQTPSLGLVRAVLTFYALETDSGWTLRPEDSPAARRADLESVAQTLTMLAPRLGYTATRETSPWRLIRWQDDSGTAYTFHLAASAVVGKVLRTAAAGRGQSILVLPGGRVGLLLHKLERDPVLRSAAEHWRVLKFRQLRHVAELTGLSRDRFEKELIADPLEAPEQMKLF